MSNTTRWIFNKTDYIKDLNNRLSTVNGKRRSSRIRNFSIKSYNSGRGIMSIKLDNNIINFCVYYITYTRVLYDGTTRNNHNILILYNISSEKDVYAIIDKNSGAKTLLRYIFLFSGRKEITQINNGVSRPLIIWLIRSIYNREYTKGSLDLDAVLGFSGETSNLDNRIRISGNDTMNLLSSLSFLLESNKLNKINILFSYGKNTLIKLYLSIDNLVGVKDYVGILISKKYSSKYGSKCKEFLPYLLIYCDILPKFLNMFRNHIRKHNVKKLYIRFLKQLADDINKRIGTRLKQISNK